MSDARKLWFCTQTRLGCTLLTLTQMFSPVFGALVVVWIIFSVERIAFPVVENFSITSLERRGDVFVASGTYEKKRGCELLFTNIMAVPGANKNPSVLMRQIQAGEPGTNSPVGLVKWGPYQIPAPQDLSFMGSVEVIGVHRCHALWSQTTTYVSLPVKDIENIR